MNVDEENQKMICERMFYHFCHAGETVFRYGD